tara:strand:+ start:2330 stop:3223 length:894 start_codon:yes stop_codon:yes gene_type:complete
MPEFGMKFTRPDHLLTTPEILRLGKLFVGLGVNKIRLTGGEPTLHKDLPEIVAGLSELDGLKNITMTTNALKLQDMAQDLKMAGLTGITVSLDSLKPEKFNQIARRNRLDQALTGIDAAINAGFNPVKINVVIMANINEDELLDFLQWGYYKPVDIRFIEYMPFPDTGWSEAGFLPYAEMRRRIETEYTLSKVDSDPSAVGKSFSVEGSQILVSFVTSMSESFCGDCNRLRITADGNIKACLFDDTEKTLRDVMRDGGTNDDLKTVIQQALQSKPYEHEPMDDLLKKDNRRMVAIGG